MKQKQKPSKRKRLAIKINGGCKVFLEHELIVTILTKKLIITNEDTYNNLFLYERIELCKEHITDDDVAFYACKIYGTELQNEKMQMV